MENPQPNAPPPRPPPQYWAPQMAQMPAVPINYGWFEDMKRNKPQVNAAAAATCIFMVGGMNLASVLSFGLVTSLCHTLYCYFIGIIIGAVISALLVRKVPKRMFGLAASILVITSGILYVTIVKHSEDAIIASRYLNGIAFGLVLISTIVDASEHTVKRFRGIALTGEQLGISSGALLTYALSFTYSNQDIILGSMTLALGGLAIIFTFLFTIESPVYHLLQNNETEALNILRQSQLPRIVTYETYDLLNENKALLAEDKAGGVNNFLPLCKVVLIRVLVSLSFSFPMTLIFTLVAVYNASELDKLYIELYILIIMLFRWAGTLIGHFTLDTLGRKAPSIFSSIIGGAFLIAVGSILPNYYVIDYSSMNVAMWLTSAYQLCIGFMAPISTCYLGEAFTVSAKPYCILVSVVIENALQISLCSLTQYDSFQNFIYALGAIHILSGVLFAALMPETKRITLRQAINKFQNLFNFGIF